MLIAIKDMHSHMIINTLDHLKNYRHALTSQRLFFFHFFNRLAGVCKQVGHFCTIFLQKLERETTKHAHENLRPGGDLQLWLRNVTLPADYQTSK